MRALRRQLDLARPDRGGRCLLMRGRRRVGKSRLVEEFCARSNVPYVFFTASQQREREPALFAEEVVRSDLPGRDAFDGITPESWDAALRLVAASLDESTPTVVVIDEFPYLVADDPSLEAVFQKQWDRLLSKKPVLLVLVGSDLAMMEALNTHGRAFFQRGTEMVVPPLSPAETGTIVGAASAADAFDAYLLTGGLPLICGEWTPELSLAEYLAEALTDPTSALIVSGERSLAAEFPEPQARAVLTEIGSGERTFTNIARAGGGMPAMSVSRVLRALDERRVVVREVPLSTKPSKEARYRIADPYLRFWLFFVWPHLAEIERGRGDLAIARVVRDWAAWRGRAIEPVIREAVSRLSPLSGLPAADRVGGYWTRSNVPEVDLIGAEGGPVARRVVYAGTIKWLDAAPLTQADLDRLRIDLAQVPGAGPDLPLVAVSRNGVAARGAAVTLGPDELLASW